MARPTAVAAATPEPGPPPAPGPAALPLPDPQPVPPGGVPLPAFDIASLLPERSAQDILAGVIRVRLGPAEYQLRVLPIKANREWKEQLELGLAGVLGLLDAAGDDVAGIMGAFAHSTPQLEAALRSYDRAGVLPAHDELEEVATDAELLIAVLGVWSAANPFAAVALSAMRAVEQAGPIPAVPMSASSPPTNGSPARTAGRPRRSRKT